MTLQESLDRAVQHFTVARAAAGVAATADPASRLRSWCEMDAARVELLLALAEEAVEMLDTDSAYYLLKAAEGANVCVVDEIPPIPVNPPVERGVRERAFNRVIIHLARTVVQKLVHDPNYGEAAIAVEPVQFAELADRIERLEVWRQESRGTGEDRA